TGHRDRGMIVESDEHNRATALRVWHQYDGDRERSSVERALREWHGCEEADEPDEDQPLTAGGGLWLTWLADALRAGGCRVREEPGWRTRGHGGMVTVRGVLAHHTGSAGMPGSRNVVRDGRADLPGPLAQLTLDPDGTFSVIAAGQCWHPGRGGPLLDCPRDSGSPYLIGIEGVSNGSYWTDAQRREYPRGIAALLRRLGAKSAEGWVAEHAEWAPGRKPDVGNWDPGDLRREVNRHLHGAPTHSPGGIETMAFGDRFRDWFGTDLSVIDWMNNQDKRSSGADGPIKDVLAKQDHAIHRIDETANAILALNEDVVKRLERIEAGHG
ncbi:MAG: N-acetylmuramoyl-L-alanine amidase, partial [Pseudonocardiaceae bacterium]